MSQSGTFSIALAAIDTCKVFASNSQATVNVTTSVYADNSLIQANTVPTQWNTETANSTYVAGGGGLTVDGTGMSASTYRWRKNVVSKVVDIDMAISGLTLSGVGTEVRVKLPKLSTGAFTKSNHFVAFPVLVNDGAGTQQLAQASINTGQDYISITLIGGGNWATGASAAVNVHLSYEPQ